MSEKYLIEGRTD